MAIEEGGKLFAKHSFGTMNFITVKVTVGKTSYSCNDGSDSQKSVQPCCRCSVLLYSCTACNPAMPSAADDVMVWGGRGLSVG